MPGPILTTKLYMPRVRPGMVARSRLLERLRAGMQQSDAGFARKLTLVSAPAGFGKTTLLSECIQQAGWPVAWLSLDQDDDEPARFWTYVIAALQTAHPHVGETALDMQRSAQDLPVEAVLTSLLNDLTRISPPLILVLDDLHLITNSQIHEGAVFFVENLPPQVHLALSSRADPPWPLARWRGRGELNELRIEDLRFTLPEATTFLNEAMELNLAAEDISTLDERIEGWIAGLQMAAISMQGRRQSQGSRGVSGFIRTFSGSHRFILDYLVEEVLEQQPSAVQDFLFKTSILERLSAPLCEAVTGAAGEGTSGLQILEYLETSNLFLIPLDDERHWYRYHHLFAELLYSRLEQKVGTEGLIQLHGRASVWYEGQGMVAEAVSHSLAADDFDRVARLVEANALRLIYHVELLPVMRWLDTLPDETLRTRPWLAVAHAWALLYAGQLDKAEKKLEIAETALAEPESADARQGTADRERMAGHIATIRSYAAMIRADYVGSLALANEALARLPDEDIRARGFAVGTLGAVFGSAGDLEAASEAYASALALGRASGDSQISVVTLGQLANLQHARGQLRRSAEYCQEALQLLEAQTRESGRRIPVAGFIHANLSRVLYEWNDLQAAREHAEESCKLCRLWGQKTIQPFCYTMLARAMQATGDASDALETIQRGQQIAASMSAWQYEEARAWEAELRLVQGELEAASLWTPDLSAGPEAVGNIRRLIISSIQTKVLVAQGKAEQALPLLDTQLEVAGEAEATGARINLLATQALALQSIGAQDRALSALEEALTLAEPEGYVRTFVDAGAAMEKLLRQAAAQGIAVRYAHRLLAVLGAPEPTTAETRSVRIQPASPPALLPLDSLSERETEVLRLLATSLSTQEIASELYVAVSTVRSHSKRLYSKLDAHSRLEAVERGKELGLI